MRRAAFRRLRVCIDERVARPLLVMRVLRGVSVNTSDRAVFAALLRDRAVVFPIGATLRFISPLRIAVVTGKGKRRRGVPS